jgi:hypothetical protein
VEKSVAATPRKNLEEDRPTPSPPPMYSQIMIPSATYASDTDGSDGSYYFTGHTPDSLVSCTQQVHERIRNSASALAAKLSNTKQQMSGPTPAESKTHGIIKSLVASELGI